MDVQAEQHLHGRVTDVIQRLRKLDTRLSRVTSSICGSCPDSSGANPKPIDENVHDKLNVAYSIISSLEDEMTRLENSVGSHQSAPMMAANAAGGARY